MTASGASRLQVLGAAFLFSTGGTVIKLCSLTSWQVASFRSGVAALTVFAILPSSRRFWHPRALVVGAAYAACLTLFVTANKNTTALHTIYLQSTAPLYLLFLSPWLLGEPVRRKDILFMAALAAGMLTLLLGTEPSRSTAPDPALGNLLAAASGLFWACTVVGLRWIGRPGSNGPSAGAAVVAGNLGAFLFCLPWALPVVGASAVDWMAIAFLGVFQIGFAYLLLTAAIGKVRALEAALLLLVEPVLNPLWAWLVQGETPGAWSVVGAGIILLGTAVHALSARESRPGSPPLGPPHPGEPT